MIKIPSLLPSKMYIVILLDRTLPAAGQGGGKGGVWFSKMHMIILLNHTLSAGMI